MVQGGSEPWARDMLMCGRGGRAWSFGVYRVDMRDSLIPIKGLQKQVANHPCPSLHKPYPRRKTRTHAPNKNLTIGCNEFHAFIG